MSSQTQRRRPSHGPSESGIKCGRAAVRGGTAAGPARCAWACTARSACSSRGASSGLRRGARSRRPSAPRSPAATAGGPYLYRLVAPQTVRCTTAIIQQAPSACTARHPASQPAPCTVHRVRQPSLRTHLPCWCQRAAASVGPARDAGARSYEGRAAITPRPILCCMDNPCGGRVWPRGMTARLSSTMRLVFSGPASHKRLAFSTQAPEMRPGYPQSHRRCSTRRTRRRSGPPPRSPPRSALHPAAQGELRLDRVQAARVQTALVQRLHNIIIQAACKRRASWCSSG
jgi:hypothetical protein